MCSLILLPNLKTQAQSPLQRAESRAEKARKDLEWEEKYVGSEWERPELPAMRFWARAWEMLAEKLRSENEGHAA